jgi:hypothetical protein
MKRFFKMFGIIALAAIVGFSMLGCVINVPDDNNGGGGTPNTSLNGVWKTGGAIININGSTGTFVQLDSNWPDFWLDAVRKGYVKVGDRYFQSLNSTGELTWSGQSLGITGYGSVATGTGWMNCTITMNANGKTFLHTIFSSDGTTSHTYTRQ